MSVNGPKVHLIKLEKSKRNLIRFGYDSDEYTESNTVNIKKTKMFRRQSDTPDKCRRSHYRIKQRDKRLRQSAKVVLTDCLYDRKLSKYLKLFAPDMKSSSGTDISPITSRVSDGSVEDINGILTPVHSVSSTCGNSGASYSFTDSDSDSEEEPEPGPGPARKKSRPSDYYEVERIEGYHRDEKNVNWYWVKWKHYSERDRTWELVENLVNCNKLLMKCLESEASSKSQIARMDQRIESSLSKCDLYIKLKRKNFSRKALRKFPTYPTLDLIQMIRSKNLKSYKKRLNEEYIIIVRCLIGMCNHLDPGMFRRGQCYKIALKVCEMREEQLIKLKEREDDINRIESPPIQLINDEDLEVPPDFPFYITKTVPGDGISLDANPVVHCECPHGCNSKSECCGHRNEQSFAYYKNGRLKLNSNTLIYECNSKCSCGEDCPNRVVQRGRFNKLAIFKTRSCGWGVKTLQPIKAGEFVSEYVGELITEEVASVRDIYYVRRNLIYMFNLDPSQDEAPYVLDATLRGNFTRYLNHSCAPNLEVRMTWVEYLDPDKPRLAFFASRDIKKGEELTFNYNGSKNSRNRMVDVITKTRCYCNKANCKEWIFDGV